MIAGAFFWAAVATLVWTLLVFPSILVIRARVRPRPFATGDVTPGLSIIIAAHNEDASLPAKLQNLAAVDYPVGLVEIIVASDGSTDATVDSARRLARDGRPAIEVLDLPRVGKARALEEAVQRSSAEILVFTDANSILRSDALRHLVSPFADPAVGGVAGNQVYFEGDPGTEGEQVFWNLERRLKQAESDAGHTISATGALYAVRRSLFRGVPEGVTDDFAVSTGVIEQGRRLVFAPDAVAFEQPANETAAEFGRKRRVMTRGLRGVLLRRRLLNPAVHGFYSLQLWTHKVLRRLMVIPALVVMITAPLVWRGTWLFIPVLLAETGFVLAALLGHLVSGRRLGRFGPVAACSYLAMVNTAALLALWDVVTGRRITTWTPHRSPGLP